MKNNPQEHSRRSIRLSDYDYSQPGAYFITLVTRRRENLFGEIRDGEVRLNEAGNILWKVWNCLPGRFPQITLGTAAVMPNHFHGIIIINKPVRVIHELPVQEIHELPLRVGANHESPQRERRRMTLPLVIGYFKMNTAKRINILLDSQGVPIWQRNYYEHIIRDDEDHNRIQYYIESNPDNWMEDTENVGVKP